MAVEITRRDVLRAVGAQTGLWLRHQPGSALSRWFHERVGDRRGKIRRITIVAVQRKLLVALWRYDTEDTAPEGAEIKA